MPEEFKQIKKRDGRVANFDQNKIATAIYKALRIDEGEAATEKEARKISDEVLKKMKKKYKKEDLPAVEEIQDMVEQVLMEKGKTTAAKSYILYREQHKKIREIDSYLNSNDLIEKYLSQIDWRVKENSNMNYSLQGLNNHLFSAVSANYWLYKVYPPEIRDANTNADLHIHDLQQLAPYCCGWDLKDVLLKGFGGVPTKIQCKPPKHLRSALGQAVNFIFTLQGEANGAQAFSSFDTYLAPFIRYDKLDYKQVKQALQEFMFNMNVPTRVGFQTPFSNITLDIKPTGLTAKEQVIIGGELQEATYADFQEEMDIFNKALAEVYMEGDAMGRVFTFPIPTYNITKDIDWDAPIYDNIWEMTNKYGIPYFANYINSDMDPDDARSMCCRLRLDNRELRKRGGGGLFGSDPLTGSIGVVTINLPRIGYLAHDKQDYLDRLAKLMDLAKESLVIKRKVIERFSDMGLYPYSVHYLKGVKDTFNEYWNNHFSTIGILGMNESIVNFMGKDIASKEGRELTLEVMDFMRDRLRIYQEETGNLFNLEATPGEGTTRKFANKDKEKFADIIVANEQAYQDQKAPPYYTNSTHLPVGFTSDIFEVLDLQDEIQTKYTGGTVIHVYLGEKMPSPKDAKNLVKKISENYELPYFSISPTFSICPVHGYVSGEHEYCPKCDEENGYDPKKYDPKITPDQEQVRLF
jgi:ribonucleoside-triphosphate reductase (formate)